MSKTGIWIEAMRLRTLPVGVAAVAGGVAAACLGGGLRLLPAAICLLFALLAQIASNFANEYFDYRAGIDAPGREGPRRGVTEGDITPRAMLAATLGTLGAACAMGLTLIWWGGWLMLPIGIAIAAGVLAYSAGPYPLSRHALGTPAVLLFYGVIPVVATSYLLCGHWTLPALLIGVALGLAGCNILLVNNYRDRREDSAAGKATEVTLLGPRAALVLYGANAAAAALITLPYFLTATGAAGIVLPLLYALAATALLRQMARRSGRALNPILGMTALTELYLALALAASAAAGCSFTVTLL